MTQTCIECQTVMENAHWRSEFCCSACRNRFNNRRMTRGAEIYDLFYTLRYDRKRAKALNVWTIMCRLAASWREEDVASGRARNCRDPQRIVEDKPWVTATKHTI